MGRELDIEDRIGGTLHIMGTPDYPVVLTSLYDDTAAAGFDLEGDPQGILKVRKGKGLSVVPERDNPLPEAGLWLARAYSRSKRPWCARSARPDWST